ncbi:phage tail tape measure protein [Desulfoluna butyratoxydans]|uniref:Phage tail tape measure protein n=1 Tax=Desulfoluna butyratoxydans TaxID=231438 RepID=A0A4U8YRF6_9BACT|nr:phage tail tape measure protein [Desulfoluna butyratoxydans]VFQ44372.1 phage tail tape measure protein [Desulfoluna butyratoxydans]
MNKDFELSIVIDAVNRYSKPAAEVEKSSNRMATRITESQKAMHALGRESKAIDRMRTLETRLSKTSAEFAVSSKRVAELGREIAKAEKPTRKLEREFDRARKASAALKEKHRQQKNALKEMRTEMRGAGVDTRNLAAAQADVARKLEEGTRKMKKMAQVSEEVTKARERMDRSLRRSAQIALVAEGAGRVGQTARGMVADPINRMRGIERSRGELASLGVKDLDTITKAGMDATRNLAGMSTAAFVSAAYDIKSGISNLTDRGVAAMTSNAAWTAKATRADVGQMTSLFATAYGSFKEPLYKNATDKEFGEIFSATLSKSVQQFKTDGAKMQQAIQSMGSGLAAAGVSLSSQMTALGMLQQKMESGVAGTTLSALERSAAQAHAKFEEMGVQIETLDDKGNMRDLPDLLAQARAAFGDNYTSEIGAKLQQAFGSDEAVKFFKAMWGQEKAFVAQRTELERAQLQREQFTRAMAKAMDNNLDARMMIQAQRWNLIKARMGNALAPALERMLPLLEKVTDWVERFVINHGGISTAIIGIVGGVGLIATVAAPVVTAVAALTTAMAAMGYQARKTRAEMAMEGMAGDDGGGGGDGKKKRKKGRRGRRGRRGVGRRGLLRRASGLGKRGFAAARRFPKGFRTALTVGKGMGRRLGGAAAVATGAISIGATLLDKDKTKGQKAASVTRDVGGIAGGAGGAMAGAALGSMIFPGVGTAIGALVGGIAGGAGGDWIGGIVGGLFSRDKKQHTDTIAANAKKKAGAVAGAGMIMAAPAMAAVPDLGTIPTLKPQPAVTKIDKSKKEFNIQFQQAPGEDPEAVARRLMAEIKRIETEEKQGALYDIE